MEVIFNHLFVCTKCPYSKFVSNEIQLKLFPSDDCPACDCKYFWDYRSTQTQYVIKRKMK